MQKVGDDTLRAFTRDVTSLVDSSDGTNKITSHFWDNCPQNIRRTTSFVKTLPVATHKYCKKR